MKPAETTNEKGSGISALSERRAVEETSGLICKDQPCRPPLEVQAIAFVVLTVTASSIVPEIFTTSCLRSIDSKCARVAIRFFSRQRSLPDFCSTFNGRPVPGDGEQIPYRNDEGFGCRLTLSMVTMVEPEAANFLSLLKPQRPSSHPPKDH